MHSTTSSRLLKLFFYLLIDLQCFWIRMGKYLLKKKYLSKSMFTHMEILVFF